MCGGLIDNSVFKWEIGAKSSFINSKFYFLK